MRVTVVGAGVIGLSVAIRAAEAGHDVHVVAAQRTPHTTSDVAAAIWFPYRAEPRERLIGWCRASLEAFRPLAADAASGVVWTDACVRDHDQQPWWSGLVDGFAAEPSRAAAGEHAFRCRVPVIAMPRYLAWLEGRAAALGVRLERQRLERLPPVAAGQGLVNCTGLGARELAGDRTLVPVRGQVVRVAAPHVREAFLSAAEPPTYIIPRADGVVLGGTAQEGDERRTLDSADEADIRSRCAAIDGRLRDAPVLGRAVGLRPYRPTVRLERDPVRPGVVHCYGHGGSGVTLSWGCADEAVRLL